MSGYYKSRHRHRLAVSPKKGVSSYFFSGKKRQSAFLVKNLCQNDFSFVVQFPSNDCGEVTWNLVFS